MIVDILESKYSIEFSDGDHDPDLSNDADGYTDFEKRKIVLRVKEEYDYTKPVLRHELIHAFLYESGLGFSWEHTAKGHDETMVDWLAIQWPKIHSLFSKLGIED